MNVQLDRNVAKKVLDTLDVGLVTGVGKPEPGQMCIEAAVCYALGEPHGDRPSCVGHAVRTFKIALNDSSRWKTKLSRASGLRRIGIAQLGSDTIDQTAFVQGLALGFVNVILPMVLPPGPERAACEEAETLEEANYAADAAYAAADAAYAAADAASYASYAAYAAAYAAANYAAAAAAHAAAAAAAAADAAAAHAAARAADADYASAAEGILRATAELTVQVLINLNCPGTQWLDLTEKTA